MPENTEQLLHEREQRVMDAIHLRIPDRVPVQMSPAYFPAKYAGITAKHAFYDYDGWLAANKKTLIDFEPDIVQTTAFFPGIVWEYLDPKALKWPGHGVPENHSHQAVEGEYMLDDEYDSLMSDRTDFVLRTFMPRAFGALGPLKKLPMVSSMGLGYNSITAIAEAMADPEVSDSIQILLKAGRELRKWRSKMNAFDGEIEKLGFPLYNTARAGVPFDTVSDFLRGMRGAMLDMYRQPDKLLELCEKILPNTIASAVRVAKRTGNPRIWMALHRGADGFMSIKQFETFYWPHLKKMVLTFIAEGLTPCIFFEGNYDSRLEYLLEIPKGKALAHFDTTDIFKAKDLLRDHLCIRGNVPSSLLQTGTPDDVKKYCKNLIDKVGKNGGLIVSARSSLDEAKPENLKAMIDYTKEYGVYA